MSPMMCSDTVIPAISLYWSLRFWDRLPLSRLVAVLASVLGAAGQRAGQNAQHGQHRAPREKVWGTDDWAGRVRDGRRIEV